MNERYLLRVINCLKHALSIIAFSQGACWAINHTLSADDATGFLNGLFTSDVNGCVNGSVRDIPHTKRLDLLANLNTSKALDALIVVTNEWERRIPFLVRKLLFVRL